MRCERLKGGQVAHYRQSPDGPCDCGALGRESSNARGLWLNQQAVAQAYAESCRAIDAIQARVDQAQQSARGQQSAGDAFDPHDSRNVVPLAIHEPLRAELEAARKRIAELEDRVIFAENALKVMRIDYVPGERFVEEQRRANRLSDEAGALRTELTQVKAENSDLRREVERLQRKAAKR